MAVNNSASKNPIALAMVNAIKASAKSGGASPMNSQSLVKALTKGFVQSKTGIKL